MVNRLHTKECQAGMQRQLRMQQYGEVQRQVNGIEHRASLSAAAEAQTEISTQTELPMPSELPGGELAVEKELSELREERIQTILASDEQALENLAEADLAYLDMVRAKSGFHHQTAGAVATSKAEHALAESWQQLIMLRLKSQKLQLQQQVQPMPTDAMKRTEDQLMQETTRIANNLQRQLADLTRHHAAASAEDCPALCEADESRCIGWTFNAEEKLCRLKASVESEHNCHVCTSWKAPDAAKPEPEPLACRAPEIQGALASAHEAFERGLASARASQKPSGRPYDIVLVIAWQRAAMLLAALPR